MDPNIVIAILGALALGLGIAAAILFALKQRADRRAADGATLEGRVQELNRRLEEAQKEKAGREQAISDLQGRVTDLSSELSAAKKEAEAAVTRAKEMIEQERESQARLLKAKEEQLAAVSDFINKADEALGTKFKALSSETLKEVSGQLQEAAKLIIERHAEKTTQDVKLHKQQIETMLQPVAETLKKLDEQIDKSNTERAQAEAVLMDQIKLYAATNEKLSNALNKPVIRGSWAEVKLESLLEAAGLVKDENFRLQVSVQEGERMRIVDALVDMAQGKKLVIDSKNLMQPYVAYANAPDDATREESLAQFRTAFRTTLRSLSLKDYAKHWEGIDAVIMFLPDEGMYMAALEADRQLIATMYEERVFVVSPVSLLPILKSVAYVLNLERLNRDTQEIADAGRALYESLGVIAGKLKTLGDKLEDGVSAYNGVIASFEGNVLPKTRRLKELGTQRGSTHPDIRPIEPELRELKDRTVRELRMGDELPPSSVVTHALPGGPSEADEESQ